MKALISALALIAFVGAYSVAYAATPSSSGANPDKSKHSTSHHASTTHHQTAHKSTSHHHQVAHKSTSHNKHVVHSTSPSRSPRLRMP